MEKLQKDKPDNWCRPSSLSPYYMENLEPKVMRKLEFWKGIVTGTMAGIAIAAVTYTIVDPTSRSLKEGGKSSVRKDRNPPQAIAA